MLQDKISDEILLYRDHRKGETAIMQGYTDRPGVRAGEKLRIHISIDNSDRCFRVDFYRQGDRLVKMGSPNEQTGHNFARLRAITRTGDGPVMTFRFRKIGGRAFFNAFTCGASGTMNTLVGQLNSSAFK